MLLHASSIFFLLSFSSSVDFTACLFKDSVQSDLIIESVRSRLPWWWQRVVELTYTFRAWNASGATENFSTNGTSPEWRTFPVGRSSTTNEESFAFSRLCLVPISEVAFHRTKISRFTFYTLFLTPACRCCYPSLSEFSEVEINLSRLLDSFARTDS